VIICKTGVKDTFVSRVKPVSSRLVFPFIFDALFTKQANQ